MLQLLEALHVHYVLQANTPTKRSLVHYVLLDTSNPRLDKQAVLLVLLVITVPQQVMVIVSRVLQVCTPLLRRVLPVRYVLKELMLLEQPKDVLLVLLEHTTHTPKLPVVLNALKVVMQVVLPIRLVRAVLLEPMLAC
jgi:hypothetical protein